MSSMSSSESKNKLSSLSMLMVDVIGFAGVQRSEDNRNPQRVAIFPLQVVAMARPCGEQEIES